MSRISDAVLDVLSPLVGRPAATMCVHAAAMSVSKTADLLTMADWPAVAGRIRTDMLPFTSPDLLNDAIAQIEARLA